jgi:hypothetical protein
MTMSGAQFLARTLDGYGVTHVFLVPAIVSWTLVELERTPCAGASRSSWSSTTTIP